MKPFGKRLLFNLCYFGLWVGYFSLSRIWFLLYYTDQAAKLDWKTILPIPNLLPINKTVNNPYIALNPVLAQYQL